MDLKNFNMKPSLPGGTRDFSPLQAEKRKYLWQTLENVFRSHGFMPLETPAMENLATLTGKYGDEGDQLIFRILNSGDFLAKADAQALAENDAKKLSPSIADKALRYDLTVPLARYVVMNRQHLSFPFRRYQIQPVWRADRPQKGRYREFIQADVDIIGTNSVMAEAELVEISRNIYKTLGLHQVVIKINHRLILQGMAEEAGIPEQFGLLTILLDKLDKIGWDGVLESCLKAGISEVPMRIIMDYCQSPETLANSNHPLIKQGWADIEKILSVSQDMVAFEPSLARGLSYYTGTIFEALVLDPASPVKSSISGGGRYDDLTGIFGMPGIPGVGISFGFDRILDILDGLQLFPKHIGHPMKALVVCMDEVAIGAAFQLSATLRQHISGIELYPAIEKLKKSLSYASDRKIPWAILIGSQEMESGQWTLKNMDTGQQESLDTENLIHRLSIHAPKPEATQ